MNKSRLACVVSIYLASALVVKGRLLLTNSMLKLGLKILRFIYPKILLNLIAAETLLVCFDLSKGLIKIVEYQLSIWYLLPGVWINLSIVPLNFVNFVLSYHSVIEWAVFPLPPIPRGGFNFWFARFFLVNKDPETFPPLLLIPMNIVSFEKAMYQDAFLTVEFRTNLALCNQCKKG